MAVITLQSLVICVSLYQHLLVSKKWSFAYLCKLGGSTFDQNSAASLTSHQQWTFCVRGFECFAGSQMTWAFCNSAVTSSNTSSLSPTLCAIVANSFGILINSQRAKKNSVFSIFFTIHTHTHIVVPNFMDILL